jgi:hypothetical protein
MGTPRLSIRGGNPDFLDLPWEDPIDGWVDPHLVAMPTGIHRHPVVFVAYPEGVYAIKEMPERLARNEYRVLEALEELTHRGAKPAGLVLREWLDPYEEQSAAVITRFVDHSFPYRRLLIGPGFGMRRAQMLDAMAGLLVEIHLIGCFWGDCSLSNVLYRYDAGGIEAVMVDAETSALYPELSDGQRAEDLEIMRVNFAGEMSDIAAMNDVDVDDADLRLGDDVIARYQSLWSELTDELVIARTEGYRIRERIGRLNDLGFSVENIDIVPSGDGNRVTMRAHVGGRTYNTDRLSRLTGIEASENQARVILGDLEYHLAKSGPTTATGKSVGTFQWLNNVYEPMIARIREVWHGEDPVQGFCDFLNHRLELATTRRADVDNEEAFASWVANGFPGFGPG